MISICSGWDVCFHVRMREYMCACVCPFLHLSPGLGSLQDLSAWGTDSLSSPLMGGVTVQTHRADPTWCLCTTQRRT